MGYRYYIVLAILSFSLSYAEAQSAKKLLIVNLRGGLDPLAAVQPLDSALQARRPYLYRTGSELLLLPARTGVLREALHDDLSELYNAYTENEAVLIHQVGYNLTTSSAAVGYSVLSRGVFNPQSSEKRGWLQRLGAAKRLAAVHSVDLNTTNAAFAGGPYEPIKLYGTDNIYNYSNDYRYYYDSTFQLDTVHSIMDSFSPGPGLQQFRQSFNAMSAWFSSVSDALRSSSFPPTGNNLGQYPNDSFGYRFREAEVFLTRTHAKIVTMEVEGFDTFSDQRRRLESRLDDLSDALATFRYRMKNAGRWQNTIVLIITDGGRSISEAGSEPTDGRIDRAYGVGSNFGGGFDVYIVSGALKSGGRTYGGYTHSNMQNDTHVQQRYHILDIYSEVIEALGYSTAGVLESYPRKDLNLF